MGGGANVVVVALIDVASCAVVVDSVAIGGVVEVVVVSLGIITL
jgi:hypothetical protein